VKLEDLYKYQFDSNVSPKNNIIGKVFGQLKILDLVGKCLKNKSRVIYYKAQCSCGNFTLVSSQDLVKGDTKSCGCLKIKLASSDLVNKKFGRLTALNTVPRKEKNKSNLAYWNCLCDCGNYHIASSRSLIDGLVTSCGCLLIEKQKINFEKVKSIGQVEYIEPLKLLQSGKILCLCHGCNKLIERKASSLIRMEVKSCGCKANELKSKAAGGTGNSGEVVKLSRIIREYISEKWTKKLRLLYGIQDTSKEVIHHLNTVSNILMKFKIKTTEDYMGLSEETLLALENDLLDYSNGLPLIIEWHKQLHKALGYNHTKKQSLIWINNKRKENGLLFLTWNEQLQKYE
jgi:hypothetical protein